MKFDPFNKINKQNEVKIYDIILYFFNNSSKKLILISGIKLLLIKIKNKIIKIWSKNLFDTELNLFVSDKRPIEKREKIIRILK